MLRLAFDFIITWRETRTRPNAYPLPVLAVFVVGTVRGCPRTRIQWKSHVPAS